MTRFQLFASGFRPTFLLAGVAAMLLIPAWIAVWVFGMPLGTEWPPTLWHAHEMLFGFVCAAVAGFLLTAVPSWTGQRAFAGVPLLVLAAIWLCGRIAVASSASIGATWTLAIDLAFLIFLVVLIAPPLLRARNRNTVLLLVVALLASCNAAFHWALMHHDAGSASHALLVALDITLLMVGIIGGRILPAFTSSGLRNNGGNIKLHAWPWISPAALVSLGVVGFVDLLWPGSHAAGVIAALAAILQAIRLLQWRTAATLNQPILWILHLGYAWLPVGLALKSAALLGGYAASAFWLHALTVGVLSTMILGVMTRAALGHTGRPLVVQPMTVSAYVLLLGAGLTRVFGLSVGLSYTAVLIMSASYWTAAFILFLFVYAPILSSPRADGKPG